MMKRLTRYFLQGVLFAAPIAVTVFVFYKVFILIDEPVRAKLDEVFEYSVPGLGFVTTIVVAIVFLTIVGFLSSNIITRSLMRLLDRQFGRFPLVKLLHSSIRDLVGAFVGDKKKFDQPVMVTLVPGSDVKVIGFVTRKSMESWGLPGETAVYLPQSYNFAGSLIVVPRDRVQPVPLASGEVMTFIISGGVSGGSAPPPEVIAPPTQSADTSEGKYHT